MISLLGFHHLKSVVNRPFNQCVLNLYTFVTFDMVLVTRFMFEMFVAFLKSLVWAVWKSFFSPYKIVLHLLFCVYYFFIYILRVPQNILGTYPTASLVSTELAIRPDAQSSLITLVILLFYHWKAFVNSCESGVSIDYLFTIFIIISRLVVRTQVIMVIIIVFFCNLSL